MPNEIDVQRMIDSKSSNNIRYRIIALCIFIMFFDGFDFTILGYVAPSIMEKLVVDKATFGLAISASVVGYMVGAFGCGDLGDRFGRKRPILLGVALFSSFTFACIFATSIYALMALRFVAGIGLGGAVANTVALNAEFSPRRTAATAIGLLFVGYTLGAAAPGWIAGLFLKDFGWQSVFVVGSVFPFMYIFVLAHFLPESVKFLATKMDRRHELISVLKKLQPGIDIDPASAIIMHREESRQGMPLRMLFADGRASSTVRLWIACIGVIGGLFFVVSWSATLFAAEGIAPGTAAMISAAFLSAGAIGCAAVPYLMDRIGPKAVLGSLAVAVPCIAAIGLVPATATVLGSVMILAGFFGSGSQAGLNAIAGTIYPTAIRSSGVGWAMGIGRIGAILAPIIGGKLISNGTPVHLLFFCSAAALTIAALAITGLRVETQIRRPLVPGVPPIAETQSRS
ncbi:MFS transporter [Rhodoblastus sp.]|uniref:MFS transporter n=1 Tax=Rhodoblastus sp. TaxID=1962975 RepID=UPI0035ADBF04